jgi:TonB-linked SusC/RagA family outer membrane protein
VAAAQVLFSTTHKFKNMKKMLTMVGFSPHAVKKALLVMKLTFLLMFVSILQVSAKVNAQERISLKLNSVEISKALNTIEKQSAYRFLYNSRLSTIRTKIKIDVTDLDIKDVLNMMFMGTDLTFKLLDNNLIVVLSKTIAFQDIRITGKITSEAGEGLSGVTITLKGSTVGTSTDNNGNFTMTVPQNAVLIISSIGYESQEVSVDNRPVINLKLLAGNKVMDEAIVIGYGSASKRDLTGSIVKIDGKEVADKPNTNPIASLQDKVAGLSVVNNGTPGAAPDIRIRGTASLGNVHPLYVVDGIFNDNIDYINPNDIESIEILKDPSSLAIFGVKGATGVIAITTKRAKAGQTNISVNSTYGFKTLVDKIKVVNASQFNTLFAEENANNGVVTPDYSTLTANTDWIDAVTRTGQFNTDNVSISASTDKNKFNAGFGYQYDEGIIKHEQLKKILASFSDELKLSKAIKFGFTMNAARTNHPYDVSGSGTDVLNNARKVMPQISAGTKPFRVQDPYGAGGDTITANLYSQTDPALQNSGVQNPLIQLNNEWNKTINIEYRIVGSVYTEVNFLKYFTARATLYGDYSEVNKRQYVPLYYAYNPVNNTPQLVNNTTSLTETDDTYRKAQQDYILTFKKGFGEHNLTLTGGFTTYYFGDFNRGSVAKQSTTGSPIPNDPRFWYINNGFVTDQTLVSSNLTDGSNSQNEYTTVSYLARALYNYKEKYFLNASWRDDGSSQIPAANRFQQFWALGGAWDLSKENFMNNQSIFDFLKLRGSIGVLGNQSAVDGSGNTLNYPFYPTLNQGANAVFGTTNYSAATPAYLANPNLKWETISAQEVGVDLNALQNRFHFEFSYYNKTTNNLSTYVSRSSIGVPDELINGGSIRNWGEEFTGSWNQKFSRDISLVIAGNITFQKNKVIKLSSDLPTGVLDQTSQNNGEAISETKAGMPIGYFKGYIVQGVFQSYADILKSPSEASLGNTRPGDLKYRDVNGDGVVDASDRTFIGNPSPKFYYGTSITLNYKGLNLSVDGGGVYGNQVYRTWGALESPFQRVNYAAFELNRWHGAGTSNWVPILSQGDRINYVGSTYSIENGSYFRIRNLQLGYNLPKSFISTLKNLRLFVNVQNLKTWKNNSGYTAEYGGNATSFGYDNGGGAIPRVTTMGLNVTF